MIKDNSASSEGLKALQKRFQAHSHKAQTYYTLMRQIKENLGSDEAAHEWMNAPLLALGGNTPSAIVDILPALKDGDSCCQTGLSRRENILG